MKRCHVSLRGNYEYSGKDLANYTMPMVDSISFTITYSISNQSIN